MRIASAIIYFIFMSTFLCAQSARNISMADVNNAQMSIDALFGNQAGLSFLEDPAITANAFQRFGLSELGNYSIGAALPMEMGTFGLLIDYYGFEGYNEKKINLSYARKLFENLSIGAQFDFFQVSIPEYGNANSFTFEFGLMSKLTRDLYLGAHIINPIKADKIAGVEEFPLVFNLGLLYKPSEKLHINLEFEKDLDQQEDIKLGIDYKIMNILYARIGAATGPSRFAFGLGIEILDKLRFDLGSTYHNVLGFSPAGGLVFNFKK